MIRVLGVFAVIPAAIFLTISFFVLVVIRKIEGGALKAFGYVVSLLLWIAALLVITVGAYTIATGRHPLFSIMQKHMQMMKCGGMGAMGGNNEERGWMNKRPMMKDMPGAGKYEMMPGMTDKKTPDDKTCGNKGMIMGQPKEEK